MALASILELAAPAAQAFEIFEDTVGNCTSRNAPEPRHIWWTLYPAARAPPDMSGGALSLDRRAVPVGAVRASP